MKQSFLIEIETTDDRYLTVKFEGDVDYEDVGVPSYELWASKREQQMAWIVSSLDWDRMFFTEQENEEIWNWFTHNLSYIEDRLISKCKQYTYGVV